MRSALRWVHRGALSLTVIVGAGCASMAGDHRLSRGDHKGAAEAYKNASYDGWWRPRSSAISAHLKLAALLATPGTPVYDPGEARRSLERIVRRAGGTAAALEAKLMLDRLDDRLADRVAELEEQLAEALAETDSPVRSPPVDRTNEGAGRLEEALAEAEGRADRLAAEVRRLEAEIAQLKALDLAIEPSEPPR